MLNAEWYYTALIRVEVEYRKKRTKKEIEWNIFDDEMAVDFPEKSSRDTPSEQWIFQWNPNRCTNKTKTHFFFRSSLSFSEHWAHPTSRESSQLFTAEKLYLFRYAPSVARCSSLSFAVEMEHVVDTTMIALNREKKTIKYWCDTRWSLWNCLLFCCHYWSY